MKTKNIFKFAVLALFAVSLFALSAHGMSADHLLSLGIGSLSLSKSLAWFGGAAVARNKYNDQRAAAQMRLSNMGGSRNPRTSNSGGVGSADPWINFGGVRNSFMDVLTGMNAKQFVVTVTNANAGAGYNLIFFGGALVVPGTTNLVLTDGVIPGTGGNLNAVAGWNSGVGDVGGCDEFATLANWNPVYLYGFQLSSNNSLAITPTMLYQPYDFETPNMTTEVLPMSSFTDEGDFKSSFITVDLRKKCWIAGNKSIFTIPIVASSVNVFTFYYGPRVDANNYLRTKIASGVNIALQNGGQWQKFSGKVR